MEYTTRVGKILTSQKLPDRYLSTKIYYPKTPKEEDFGTLFILVEILNPWFPSAEIANAICTTMIDRYYHPEHDFLENIAQFEEALKGVNQRLADFASKGVTSWLGNLNCTILVIRNENLFISHSGSTQLYLFRDQTLSEVCEDIPNKQSSPLSTFITITNGTLEKGDKLLLTNKKLLDVVSLQSLREIINFTGPISAIHQIAKILRRQRVKDVNSIIFELIKKDDRISMSEAELEGEDVIYIDQIPAGAWERLFAGVKPVISKKIDKTSKDGEKFWNRFLIKTQDALSKTPAVIKHTTTFLGHHSIKAFSIVRRKQVKKVIKKTAEERYYLKPKIDLKKQRPNLLQAITEGFKNFLVFLKELFLVKNRKKLYGVLILLFIVIFGISLYGSISKKKNPLSSQEVEKVIAEARKDIKEAKTFEAQNQKQEARTLLIGAFDGLKKVQSSPKFGEEIQELLIDLAGDIDRVDITSRFLSTEEIDLLVKSPDTKMLSVVNETIYFVSKLKLESYDLEEETKKTIGELPETIKGVEFMCSFGQNSVAFYTDNQKIYLYDGESKNFKKANLASGGNWLEAIDFDEYSQNLYLLEDNGTVERYTGITLGFSSPRKANSIENLTIQAQSLAIDGNIFVLDKKKKIYKFFRGQIAEDYKIKVVDSGLEFQNPTKIFTNEELTAIYVLDHFVDFDGSKISRILEFTKNGEYLGQFKFGSKLGEVRDFTIDSRSKTLIVLTSKYLLATKL